MKEALILYLKEKIAINKSDEDFTIDKNFMDLGLESNQMIEMTKSLGEDLGIDLYPTLFFENQNIEDLSTYLLEGYSEQISMKFGNTNSSLGITGLKQKETFNTTLVSSLSLKEQGIIKSNSAPLYFGEPVAKLMDSNKNKLSENVSQDIAIIGLSGRYPGANTMEDFWDNLKNGIDSVTEIPHDRWDMVDFYDEDKDTLGKSYSKWGGFIDDIDKFDPLFFNISPREAEIMDPQERLFLQTVWESLEDGGYTRERLQNIRSSKASKLGGHVGVYAGVMYSEYQLFGAEETLKGNPMPLWNSPSSIANRVSYYLNLHGPSMGVDTMCSSSLTAIHLAIDAINNGHCGMAIAGGVNLSVHPNKYKMLSQNRFVSDMGRCESFGEGGSGYVPSEGVGVVLLKHLSQAKADGDQIYGVIKGSCLNHGGKTNGYSVPNPNAQAEVIRDTIIRAGVKPEDFSYIEAHGTGTNLGDPIEIAGLSKAFESNIKESQYCAIGSVKSNIGHCESAAGISGLAKVLLQLKHKQIVPSLHSEILNTNIDFKKTPFKVQQELKNWEVSNDKPRLAGISSFGAGGSNAHIIIEEYISKEKAGYISDFPTIIVLSARNKNRLNDKVKKLLNYLEGNIEIAISDIAYTLQIGRESMEERLSFIVLDFDDLITQLGNYKAGKTEGLFIGNAKNHFLLKGEAGEVYLNEAIANKQSEILVQLWSTGTVIDWTLLYQKGNVPNIISLPAYSFERNRYWFDSHNPTKTQKFTNKNHLMKLNTGSIWESEKMQQNVSHVVGDEINTTILNGVVALVKMQSRESKNMFTLDLIKSLQKTFLDLRENKNLKAVVLTGYDNIFCMGGSQEALQDIASKKGRFTDFPFLYRGLLEFDIPVITAMQGHAFGGGMLFGLYGDIVLMSQDSIYTANFMKYGFTPGMGATYILGEKLGKPLATEMMYTARHLKGSEIKSRGASVIVTRNVLNEALRIAQELSLKPRKALEVLKKNMSGNLLLELQKHINEEEKMHELTFHTEEVTSKIAQTFKKQGSKDSLLNSISEKIIPSKVLVKTELVSVESVMYQTSKPITQRSINSIKLKNTNFSNTKNNVLVNISNNVKKLKELFEDILHIPSNEIGEDVAFVDLGLDSISGVELIRSINNTFNVNFEAIILYDYYTINKLSGLISKESNLLDESFKEDSKILLKPTLEALVNEESIADADEMGNEKVTKPSGTLAFFQEKEKKALINISNNVKKLKELFEDVLHIPSNEIDEDVAFVDLGLDSISGVELIRSINNTFNVNFEAIILYDYYTINKLSDLISKESNLLDEHFREDSKILLKPTLEALVNEESIADADEMGKESLTKTKLDSYQREHEKKNINKYIQDIAIIGMSGRFPDALNVNEFWENIKTGKNSIKEVPERKWSIPHFFDKDIKIEGKSYGKWMGYLDDEDKFDPLFFNISPREAERMDPQQRLFIEESWKAIEDSGYTSELLSNQKCGVFVGVGQGDYMINIEQEEMDNHTFTGTSSSILAGRISYHLNLDGPAISIDTACSSSLVAIHQACQSIRIGECETALAGGVYVMTSERMHIATSKSGMLSEDGKCHTFDNKANGFVPGEAVGVLLLKSLSKAEIDGDRVYGVIKGSAINQDGKTNGITAPNVDSQNRLQIEVYKKYNIDPSDITYVESHGTGTKLGDPIEIKALRRSFESYTNTEDYCGIGSVKTNIGHTLTASGVAGVIKVLLSIKNKQIPPTLNFNALNEHINLIASPFYVNTSLKEWQVDEGKSRKAAISGFGFSGTNAHIVIEEYIPKTRNVYEKKAPVIILLSAKNKNRLEDQANNLEEYLESNSDLNLRDIAYTLQIGRESMEERLAFVVRDKIELKNILTKFILGETKGLLCANIKESKGDFVFEGNTGKEYLSVALKNKDLSLLAQLWIKGVVIDWQLLYEKDNTPNKISLPTYPFARERYWIPEKDVESQLKGESKLHPLLHFNESNLKEQKYTSIYTGEESFLSDHKVKEDKVLPGVAYLELARVAGNLSIGDSVTQLKDITWISPIHVNSSPEKLSISIYPLEDSFGYEVYSTNNDEEQIHSQGKLSTSIQSLPPNYDLLSIKKQLTKSKTKDWCYDFFKGINLNYGPSFQGIEQLWYNDSVVLSRIRLPKEEGYLLQPGILDSALQTCIGFAIEEETLATLHLPFSLKELTIFKDLTETVWCYVKKNTVNSKVVEYDIDLLNELGEVLISFKEFVVLPLNNFSAPILETKVETHLYTNTWGISSDDLSTQVHKSQIVLVAGGSIELTDLLREDLEIEVLIISGESEQSYFLNILEIVRTKIQDNQEVHITLLYENDYYVDYGFISGLLKTASLENPRITGKALGVDSLSITCIDSILSILYKEQVTTDSEVRYIGSNREIKSLSVSSPSIATDSVCIKEGGVYLITGGFGGLGQIFTSHINKTKGVHLILIGRSALTKEKEVILSSLQQASYYCCDVSKKEEVVSLMSKIKESHGKLNGIIHSAGVIQDSIISKKTSEEVNMVFSSKVSGVKNLDEASKGDALDFMLFFSSIAGVLGNIGQSDYSSANAYLDNYALYREEKRLQGERQGKTLSINWPLWEQGGMHIEKESAQFLEKYWGMLPLPTLEGVKVFDELLNSSILQGIVAFGYKDKVNKKLIVKKPIQPTSKIIGDIEISKLQEKVTIKILETASDLLKLDISNIEIDEELGDYGFDSILSTQFSNELNSYYDLELMPTTFYNYPTIEMLVVYLLEDYSDKLFKKHDLGLNEVIDIPNITKISNQSKAHKQSRFLNLKKQARVLEEKTSKKLSEGVAIVGISGRFPGSPDLETFWNHIKNNQDLITEIPNDRWDWREYYGDSKLEKSKTKAKWGGFIKDIDKFDPLFFGISPREAELMDPQQRIILESVYQALEDASIATDEIRGSNTGVFVGVASSDYSLLLTDQLDLISQAQYPTGSSHSVLVNRISYLLDLHGPSEPVDTACSSSLVAIHRAVEHIMNGHCDIAIAGGVNALLSPILTLSFSQAGMLSEDGRCKTFDQEANGYVRGEGVGTIILKSLDKAEADGDHIYGVIKSTAENHGGKANTLTSPNPNAQKNLLLKAYRSAGVDPRDVSYIEAHGTGTPLGDPIEIEGLKLAFKELYKEKNYDIPKTPYCGIGSVKTNIGHLEAAAGMAGVIKVLLSLKHQILPGNVHLKTPNEYLQLSNSPFYLQEETKAWKSLGNKPRIAGVSSFGFGGANSHIIIEEYIPKTRNIYEKKTPVIILLSAKNKNRLQDQANNLEEYLESNSDLNLHDIAYTLQIGRESMEERVAFISNDKNELQEQLNRFKRGQIEEFLTGNSKKEKNNFLLEGAAGEAYIQTAISSQQIKALAQLWTKGVVIDWQLLYEKDNTPNKISLPTYPFARERYWIPEKDVESQLKGESKLHPLLHFNESNLKEQKYTSIYTGEESFLSDHKVKEDKVLPGVAYLELARVAGNLSIGDSVTQLKDITWISPIHVNSSPEKLSISIYPLEDSFGYEVYSTNNDEEQIHSQGKLSTSIQSLPPNYDLLSIKKQLTKSKTKDWCYDFFKGINLNYGPSFQGIEQLWYNDSVVLSRIRLPKEEGYLLQPGILDSALQTCIGFAIEEETLATLHLPFSLKELTIFKDLTETVWCYVKKNTVNSKVVEYDIDLLNELGEVLISFKEFVVLPLNNFSAPILETKVETHLYTNTWGISSDDLSTQVHKSQIVLVAGGSIELTDLLREDLEIEVLIISGESEQSYFLNILEIVRTKIQDNQEVHITLLYENDYYVDYGFISGLLKTASLENPRITGKALGVDSLSITCIDSILSILYKEQVTTDSEVRYIGSNREIKSLSVSSPSIATDSVCIKEGGVYLITGGFGGLGQIFTSHINKTKGVHLILIGRSALTKEKEVILSSLQQASYYCCDVSKKEEVVSLMSKIKESHGKLNGIIHSAGVIQDSIISKKTSEEVNMVFSSKVSGVKNLDEASKGDALDFMLFFSSIAGVLGNIGQSDYSSANAYLDNYALYREEKRLQGERQGKTLSINWPLWEQGGMHIEKESAQFLEKYWGMLPLPTLEGVKVFDELLNSSILQGIVAFGYKDKVNKKLIVKKPIQPTSKIIGDIEISKLQEKVTIKILETASDLLKLDISNIEIDEELGDYGFDSILSTQFSNELNSYYDLELMPTTFYNYPTIEMLVVYLLEDYSDKLFKKHDLGLNEVIDIPNITKISNQSKAHKQARVLEVETIKKPLIRINELNSLVTSRIKSNDEVTSDLNKHVICFKEAKKGAIAIIIPGMPGIVDGYYELAKNLKEESVFGVHMVGFDGKEPLISMESIAEHYCEMIKTIAIKEDINLYAHSFGGLVLFELLGLLKNNNIEAKSIVLLDSYTNTLKMKSKERLAFFIHLLCEQLKLIVEEKEIIEYCQKISKRPRKNRIDLIYNFLIEKGAIINKEFFSRIYTLYDYSMSIKYKLKHKLPYDITLVKANESFSEFDDDALGWSSYYKSIEVINSPGDHFNIIKKPFLSEWINKLRK
ncbi:SDR family NAD(P)-dependent oxidoreductase [Aquimarina sp. I32.4]|uniref:SDR family NAD(P)-dependent oxidoreductase n=1 Tax=Aquimarina sp. I32.4 TaxID=2053903 RepID=UPI000CDEE8C4|nr:SDR family NAD(P)-dependent oxidoreductase [Aquimarina sp. I32.4]